MSPTAVTLRERAEEAQRRAARLAKLADFAEEVGEEGLAELVALIAPGETNGNGHATTTNGATTKPDGPRGREAVRIIVRRRPGIWTMQQLRAEMEREGWYTSPSGLEAAVKRLCDVNGEGKRVGKGRYVFPANHGEEAARATTASDGAVIPSSGPLFS